MEFTQRGCLLGYCSLIHPTALSLSLLFPIGEGVIVIPGQRGDWREGVGVHAVGRLQLTKQAKSLTHNHHPFWYPIKVMGFYNVVYYNILLLFMINLS